MVPQSTDYPKIETLNDLSILFQYFIMVIEKMRKEMVSYSSTYSKDRDIMFIKIINEYL